MVGSKVIALSNRYSSLAQPDLHLTEYGFHIHFMEKGIWKLQQKFHRDPTGGSKVIALSNRYSSLARPDLHLTEYGFHMHSMEKGLRKLLQKFDRDPSVGSKVMAFRTVRYCW